MKQQEQEHECLYESMQTKKVKSNIPSTASDQIRSNLSSTTTIS